MGNSMAKVYDIVSRLKNEKPQVRLTEDKIFTVFNSKNSVILMKGIAEDPKIDETKKMDMIIEAGLGKEALDLVNSMDLSMMEMATVVNAIMAAVSDSELEEIEKAAEAEVKKTRKK